jgi:uncharacterized membrane protein YraQ (UPF0718 family)
MGTLAALIASFIDPIRFGITLGVSLCSRKWWIVAVAAIVSAIISETLLTSIQTTRQWGDGMLPGIIASVVQAVLCYSVIGIIRRSRKQKPTTR